MGLVPRRLDFDVFGRLLMRRGAWAWFHDVWTLRGQKVLNTLE